MVQKLDLLTLIWVPKNFDDQGTGAKVYPSTAQDKLAIEFNQWVKAGPHKKP